MKEISLTRKLDNPRSLFCLKDESKKSNMYIKGSILNKSDFLEYAKIHWNFNSKICMKLLQKYYSYYEQLYDSFDISEMKRNGKYQNFSFNRLFCKIGDIDASKQNTTIDYYINRGYSKEESIIILKKRQNTISKMSEERYKDYTQKLSKSLSKEIQINKHGIEKYKEICKNKGKSMSAEYISNQRNISVDSAKQIIKKRASNASLIGWDKIRNGEIDYIPNTSLEFYLNKGLDYISAKDALSERQSTFSFKKCIEKYGNSKGRKIFKERQEKWQRSLENKTDEEKLDIYIRRFSHKNARFFSTESILFIEEMLKYLDIFSTEIYYGKNEYFLYDSEYSKIRFYDFVDLENKFIVEYNGSHVHASEQNKETFSPIWDKELTWEKVKKEDNAKIENAKRHGFNIVTVWDYQTLKEKLKTIEYGFKCN